MSLSKQINKIIHYFQKNDQATARLAKDRLQIIIAHERTERDKPDYLAMMQQELLDVVAKYVSIDRDDVKVELERKEGCSILELNVILPNRAE